MAKTTPAADSPDAAATDATAETVADTVPEQAAPPAQDAQDGPVTSDRWKYTPTDDVTRVYTHVPVTVATGDVIHHPGEAPAQDGHWTPTDDQPTRGRDNDPAPTNEPAE